MVSNHSYHTSCKYIIGPTMPRGIYERTPKPIATRLFAKTIKTETCWLWQGSKGPMGHGQIYLGPENDKRLAFAHRVSWELHYGKIPSGLFVLHKCDVPNCIRPDHLFLGTKADNSKDMVSKGRQKRGEQLPQTKLTADIVRQIKTSTESCLSIAKTFGISPSHAWNIRAGKRWGHIDNAIYDSQPFFCYRFW